MALVDQPPEGKRKVGESLPGAVLRLLKKLGINGIEALLPVGQYKKCLANASSWGHEDWIYQSGVQNPEGGGYHINRAAFDQALLQHARAAGVAVYADKIDAVLRLPVPSQGFSIGLQDTIPNALHAQWLIDATGRKLALGRKLGLKRQQTDRQMAAVHWVKTPAQDTDQATRIKSVPEGWWYTSLLPDQSRVIGFQGLPDTVGERYQQQEVFFEQFNAAQILPYSLQPQDSLEHIATAAGLAQTDTTTSSQLLCVGDAALSFDPLSSQGIFFALYSGIKAADAIIRSLADPTAAPEALTAYQAAVQRVFEENRKSLAYFYRSELRYGDREFWRAKWG